MPSLSTGINRYYLLQYLENISQLCFGNANDDDISEDVVLQFIKEGFQRIVSLTGKWPWYQSIYTFNTVNNQREYGSGFTLTQTSSSSITTPASNKTLGDIREVINIVNNTNGGNELLYIDQFKAEQIWVGTNDTSGIPTYWSIWAGKINIWPKPDGVYSMTIRGYRVPSLSWLNQPDANSTDYVDLDEEFHMMLVNFVMARLFQYEEDGEMAAVYMRHFEQGVAIARENLTAPNANQPLVLSGGLTPLGFNNPWPYGTGTRVIPGSPNPFWSGTY